MFLIKLIFIVYFIFLFVLLGRCLVTLPKVEDNNIIHTEFAIRKTINGLFSSLGVKNVRDKLRLKQYSVAHNYFVSITLQDYTNLKEIAKLTRVVKSNLSDTTTSDDYITLINEILDEENVNKLKNIILGEHTTPEYDIGREKTKLEFLNKYHADLKDKYTGINADVLKILLQDESLEFNDTAIEDKNRQDSSENVLEDLPTWHADGMPTSGRRLYDSKQTKIKKFPFMASVQIFNKFQCSGSIIKADLVVTAASCLQLAWNNRFYRENPAFLSVRVGSSYYEIGGEQIAVLEVYFHPTYDPKTLHNNIAVMRLVRFINMNRKKGKVKKILLDDEESNLPLNVEVEVLGWGAHSRGNKLSGPWEDKLRYATLSAYPLDDCQDIYTEKYVTKKNFCAGAVSVGSGACNRDAGGPGIVFGKLAGIISFGSPVCGSPDSPTVFTKVGYYYDWIEDIMEQNVPVVKKRTTSLPPTFPYAAPVVYSPPHRWSLLPILTTPETSTKKLEIDNELFKDFLRTMFDSAEIEDYFDSIKASFVSATQTTMEKQVTKKIIRNGPQPVVSSETTNPFISQVSSQDPITLKTQDTAITQDTLNNPITLSGIEENVSVSSSEDNMFSSPSTAVMSYKLKSVGTNVSIGPDLVMDYDIDSTQEVEQQDSKRIYQQTNQLVKTENEIPIMLETNKEMLNNSSNAANGNLDNALLALLYISDSEKEKIDQAKLILNNEERKNNPESFIEPILPTPFKDLTLRNKNLNNNNLRKLLNDDTIIDFLKKEVIDNMDVSLLQLK